MENLTKLLSALRGLYQLLQHAHWQSEGKNYYGDHLLFQRLYEDVVEELDQVAEKAIGISNKTDIIDPKLDSKMALDFVNQFYSDDFIAGIINAEKAIIDLLKSIQEEKISGGIDDMIQAMESKHEEHLYLLQQRSKSAFILNELIKIANKLDSNGDFETADKIDETMQDIYEEDAVLKAIKKLEEKENKEEIDFVALRELRNKYKKLLGK